MFVRMANKELGRYGTWKTLRRMGGEKDMGLGVSAEPAMVGADDESEREVVAPYTQNNIAQYLLIVNR
jgi:hypothetical protein